jgi:hypothetical protein
MGRYWSKLLSSSPITTDEGKGYEDSKPCLPSTRDTRVGWRECSSVDDYMKRCRTLWAGRDERKAMTYCEVNLLLGLGHGYDMPLQAGTL